jgi:hypothetical protein
MWVLKLPTFSHSLSVNSYVVGSEEVDGDDLLVVVDFDLPDSRALVLALVLFFPAILTVRLFFIAGLLDVCNAHVRSVHVRTTLIEAVVELP